MIIPPGGSASQPLRPADAAGRRGGWRPANDHRAHSAKLFVALAVAIVAAVFMLFQFARLAKQNRLRLSDGTFRVRGATAQGQRFDKHPENGPYLFSDPTGSKTKDIFVSHITVGDTWAVFAASVAGDRRCTLQWRRASRDLLDPCSKKTYNITGDGLPQYEWKVTANDQLVIDLNKVQAGPGGPSTSLSTGPTSVVPLTG